VLVLFNKLVVLVAVVVMTAIHPIMALITRMAFLIMGVGLIPMEHLLLVVVAPLVVVPLLVDKQPLGMGPLDFLAMVMVAVVPVVVVVVEEAMDQLTLTTVVASFSRLMIRRRSTARTPR
jgi:hypothetical protein